METVLIVDDSASDRSLAEQYLMARPGLRVLCVANGREALAAIRQSRPDLVLTDLQMPLVDGLELTESIRRDYPSVPVVLMTAFGSFDTAVAALERGAASYVPKANLAQDLLRTVEDILSLTKMARGHDAVLGCMTRAEYSFTLANDPTLIPPLVERLGNDLRWAELCDEAGQLRVGVAIREALFYAMEHGNLEAPTTLKQTDEAEYQRLVAERRSQLPYRDRRVHLDVRASRPEVVYTIRDEGAGFPLADLPDPADLDSLGSTHGRGLVLIRTLMDEVRYSPDRNAVTMVKRREG